MTYFFFCHLHISIDASGSMNGDKWINTIKSTVAICKAASMIQNVDVIVSFRSTHETQGGRGRESQPIAAWCWFRRECVRIPPTPHRIRPSRARCTAVRHTASPI
mgnify:CR=1 FL=1